MLKKLSSLFPKQTELNKIIKDNFDSIYDISTESTTLVDIKDRKRLTHTAYADKDVASFKESVLNFFNSGSIYRLLSKEARSLSSVYAYVGTPYVLTKKEILQIKNPKTNGTVEVPDVFFFYSKFNPPSSLYSPSLQVAQEGSQGGMLFSSFENSICIRTLYNHDRTVYRYGVVDAAALYRCCLEFKQNRVNNYCIITSAEFEEELIPLLEELKATHGLTSIKPIYVPSKDLLVYGLYAILVETSGLVMCDGPKTVYLSRAMYKTDTYLEALLPINFAIAGLKNVTFCYVTDKQVCNFPELRRVQHV
jgi:hypothetical protein